MSGVSVRALLCIFLALTLVIGPSSWAKESTIVDTFSRLQKMGIATPIWFLNQQAAPDSRDATRPKTPLDKTASLQVNFVFDGGADRPKSCEVLMTNAPTDASAELCESLRKTYRISPSAIQNKPSQRHFWVHVYTDGDDSQLTMTEPVLSRVKP